MLSVARIGISLASSWRVVVARSKATKQSKLGRRAAPDCFGTPCLAMTATADKVHYLKQK